MPQVKHSCMLVQAALLQVLWAFKVEGRSGINVNTDLLYKCYIALVLNVTVPLLVYRCVGPGLCSCFASKPTTGFEFTEKAACVL